MANNPIINCKKKVSPLENGRNTWGTVSHKMIYR